MSTMTAKLPANIRAMLNGHSLPADWRIERIDVLAERGTGHTPERDDPTLWNGGIPWVSLADADRLDRVFIDATTHDISAKGIEYSSAVLHPANSVLLSRDAGVGQAAIMRRPMAVSQHFVVWRPSGELEPLYLYYWLQLMKSEFERQAVGSTIVTIGFGYFRRLYMIAPPRAEQTAIAGLLKRHDDLVACIHRLIDAKQRTRDGLAAELLTGRRRLPAFAGRPWREVTIGDLLREENRFVRWSDAAEYDLVSVRRWAGGVYTRDRLRGSEIKVKVLKRIRAGDILISHIQSAYGAMALVGDDHDGHYVSDLYMVMVPRERDVCNSRFFGWHCRRPWMWHQAKVSSNGFMAERLRIVFDPVEFLKRPISVPLDIAEQSAIADILDAATQEIEALDRLRDAINRQKRGLMQGLLTGKIRIKEDSHG